MTRKEVYAHLMDDESRFFYEKRLAWWKTGDPGYLLDSIRQLPQIKTWDAYVKKCEPFMDRLIVYGACEDYKIFRILYPTADFLCFCDRNESKQQNGWLGKKVISPEELVEKYADHPILINADDYYAEIEAFLLENGIPQENIYNKGKDVSTLYPCQYFDRDIMKPVAHEVFVDGGAYDLETTRKFIEFCDGKYDKIYSFEPDAENYRRCRNSLSRRPIERLELVNKGTWDKKETLHFHMNGVGSMITETTTGTVTIETAAIDEIVKDDKVTFLKLDVEGAEMKALQGAKNTIMKNKPRLAVCIYHKPEDIIEIPAYLLSLNPDYHFYIRHYKLSYNETVLYAIP